MADELTALRRERDAQRTLEAAAPDMLAALKFAVRELAGASREKALAAIAKAEGR